MIQDSVYRPSLSQFRRLAEQHSMVPVVREFAADLETPVSVYVKLMGQTGGFVFARICRRRGADWALFVCRVESA